MKTLTCSICAAAFALTASAAQAVVIDTKFSGFVTSQTMTKSAVGSTVSGEFTYDTASKAYLMFTVGGISIPAGYASQAVIGPQLVSALYKAQISPVSQGGTVNDSFSLDLEALGSFPSSDAVALLTNTSQLTTNLDLASNQASEFPSSFSFSIGKSNGAVTQSLNAKLTSVASSVQAVPEPASLALLALTLTGFAALRRRL